MSQITPPMPLLNQDGFSRSQSEGDVSNLTRITIDRREEMQNNNSTEISKISNEVNENNLTID